MTFQNITSHLSKVALVALAGSVFSCTKQANQQDNPKKATEKKPNFLFIFIDDLGWPAVSCYGNNHVDTDNIDRLAEEGIKFTDAYVTPQCTPSRASLLTGQHTARNEMWHVVGEYYYPYARVYEPDYKENLPRETYTLAEALKSNGYTTALLGKWHLHTWEKDGYYTRLWDSTKMYYGFDYVNPETDPPEYQSYGDKGVDFLTDEAIKFMKKNKDTSFFIYLSHHTIHGPILAPDSLVKKYKQKNYPDTGVFNATYLAALNHMDNSIGRLLDALDKLELSNNTAVFFLSDNGGVDKYFDNAPLRWGKGAAYEGGIRVPFMVRWPGHIKPGTVSSEPVQIIDIYPTLVDMAGGNIPENHTVDGLSLKPLFEGTDSLQREALYWYMPLYDIQWGAVPSAIIRKGNYKLIDFFGDYIEKENDFNYIPEGRVELYDLSKDVGEQNNLVDEMPGKAEQMQKELRNWIKEMNQPIPHLNPDYDKTKVYEVVRER